MREILDDLGLRHAEEGAWPAARVARRRLDLGRRRRQQVAAPAARVWRRGSCVSLGGSPAPPYIGGGAGRPRGGRGVPPQLGLGGRRRLEEGTPPQLGFPLLLFSSFQI